MGALRTHKRPALMAPEEMPETPSGTEIIDFLLDEGYRAADIGIMMETLREAAEAINLETRTSAGVEVNMVMHDLLEDIMPDRRHAKVGSFHERLNAYFQLPDEWSFVHDITHACVVQALPR